MNSTFRRTITLATTILFFWSTIPARADLFSSRIDREKPEEREVDLQELQLEALRSRLRAELLASGVGTAEVDRLVPADCDLAELLRVRRRVARRIVETFPEGPPTADRVLESQLLAAWQKELLREFLLGLGEPGERAEAVLSRTSPAEVQAALERLEDEGILRAGSSEGAAALLIVGLICLIPPLTPIGVGILIVAFILLLVEEGETTDDSGTTYEPPPDTYEPPPGPPATGSGPFVPEYVPGHGEPTIYIMNLSSETITVDMNGWSWSIAAGDTLTVTVPPGTYSLTASAPGVLPYSGMATLEYDYEYSWEFTIEYQ